ncbi:MAG: CNNM domain-containing protein, partial [Marmoricola sp.]
MDWLLLGICVVLIALCGLFGAAEYSLVAVDRAQIAAAARAGDKQARGVNAALSRLSTQLSGAQVGITITNLAIGFLAEPSISHLLRGPLRSIGVGASATEGISVALGMIIATIGTMLFGELVPKKIAIARPDGTARRT